jgi:hypothetical protein
MKKGRKRSAPKKDPAKRQRALKRSKSKAIELRTRKAKEAAFQKKKNDLAKKQRALNRSKDKASALRARKAKATQATTQIPKAKAARRQQKSVVHVRRKIFTKSWLEAVQMQIAGDGSSSGASSSSDCDCGILRNGDRIRGEVQNVLPGEQISLSIYCENCSISNVTWTIPGQIFADYKVSLDSSNQPSSAQLTPFTGFSGSTEVDFYWADAGESRVVSVRYQTTGPESGESHWETDSVTFNVVAPASQLTAVLGSVRFYDSTKSSVGLFGAPGKDGIQFTAEVDLPSGFMKAGRWNFVQVVSSYASYINDPARGGWFKANFPSTPSYPTPLDTFYPDAPAPRAPKSGWPGSFATGESVDWVGDNPSQETPLIDQWVVNASFETYLMFKPFAFAGTVSKWVPLRKLQWQFNLCAMNYGGSTGWGIGSRGQSMTASVVTSNHPQWAGILDPRYFNSSTYSPASPQTACPYPPIVH